MKQVAAALAVVLLSGAPAVGRPALAEGDVVPADAVPLVDLDGSTVDLRAALATAGTPASPAATLVVFWATWCKPCIHEIPEVRELGRYYSKSGLRVIGVAVSHGGDTIERVAQAARTHGIDYSVLFDKDDRAWTAFGLKALPAALLVDGGGKVLWLGTQLPSDINGRIKAALGQSEESGDR